MDLPLDEWQTIGTAWVEVEPCRARVVERVGEETVFHPFHTYSPIGVYLRDAKLFHDDQGGPLLVVTFRETRGRKGASADRQVKGTIVGGTITWDIAPMI